MPENGGWCEQGLEPEMQRMITQHASELQAVKQQASDACQQRLHELMVQVGPHRSQQGIEE